MANDKNELATIKNIYPKLEKMKSQLCMALPKHLNSERLTRIALTLLRETPKLTTCTSDSFLKCLMVTAQLGLEPGLLGHVYFVPYGKEATIIIGYKGMLDLATRSGKILSIEARVIRTKEKCAIKYGLDSSIDHEIDHTQSDRGETIGYYAVAKLVGGGTQFEFMHKTEIDKVRNQSKAGQSGPWVTHYDEMAKKTCIRRLFKYLPISIELQSAINLDEANDTGNQARIIDYEFDDTTVDTETGEVIEPSKDKDQGSAIMDKIK